MRLALLALALVSCSATEIVAVPPCEGGTPGLCAVTIRLLDKAAVPEMFGPAERKKISAVAAYAKKHPSFKVVVQGHVYSSGNASKEITQSGEVAAYARGLLTDSGVPPTQKAEDVGLGAELTEFEPAVKRENLRVVIMMQDSKADASH